MRYFFEDVYEHLQIEKHVNRACCPPPNECYIWEFDKYLKIYEEEEQNPKIKGIFPHPYEYSNLIIGYCDDFVKRKTPFISTSTYEIYKISFKNDIIAAAYDILKRSKFKQGDISYNTDEESIELINDTETYKRLLEFESLVNIVKHCDENDKKEVLNIWNELQPKHNYNEFSKFIDFIEHRYKKMYNRCVDIASHIIAVKQNDERTSGIF